jgi:formylglycine-generating enzyme required for sulfatase activity
LRVIKRCPEDGQEFDLEAVECVVCFGPLRYWCSSCHEWRTDTNCLACVKREEEAARSPPPPKPRPKPTVPRPPATPKHPPIKTEPRGFPPVDRPAPPDVIDRFKEVRIWCTVIGVMIIAPFSLIFLSVAASSNEGNMVQLQRTDWDRATDLAWGLLLGAISAASVLQWFWPKEWRWHQIKLAVWQGVLQLQSVLQPRKVLIPLMIRFDAGLREQLGDENRIIYRFTQAMLYGVLPVFIVLIIAWTWAHKHNEVSTPGAIRPVAEARQLQKASAMQMGTSVETINSIGMMLVLIPAGEFQMGSPIGEIGRANDEQQHRVRIANSFYLGVTEVTQAQYKQITGENPSYFLAGRAGESLVADVNTDNLPVEQVSWDDAVAFCQKLGQREGKTYRLPTEAEWEYACRAGTTAPFHFGSALQRNVANFTNDTYLGRTAVVGLYAANAFGVYDMHGNVWEWCSDWYGADYYGTSEADNPQGPNTGSDRVHRGGGWCSPSLHSRSASRSSSTPSIRYYDHGFRVVQVVENEK